jgi:hypothetical protein
MRQAAAQQQRRVRRKARKLSGLEGCNADLPASVEWDSPRIAQRRIVGVVEGLERLEVAAVRSLQGQDERRGGRVKESGGGTCASGAVLFGSCRGVAWASMPVCARLLERNAHPARPETMPVARDAPRSHRGSRACWPGGGLPLRGGSASCAFDECNAGQGARSAAGPPWNGAGDAGPPG